MQTLILSALETLREPGRQAAALLADELSRRGWPARTFDLSTAHIGFCRGCGACSLTSPGRCGMKDDMQEILPAIVKSDCLVLATPVFFGGHHPVLKQAVDRFLPLAAPVWVQREGELHHAMRYPRRPALLGLGMLPAPDPEQGGSFARLIERHRVNLDFPRQASVVLSPARLDESGSIAIRAALDLLEAKR